MTRARRTAVARNVCGTSPSDTASARAREAGPGVGTVTAVLVTAMALVVGLGLPGDARADDGPGTRMPTVPKVVRQECAACHVVYPPGLLPAASWQRLLSDLPHHFGTDASLEPAALAEASAWFAGNAGTSKRVKRDATPPPEDRITRAAWFRREHDEVPAATWRLPSVRTPANCAACHTRADEGDFRERFIRLPR